MGERVEIAPRFEEMFPDLAKQFRKLGVSVWMPLKAGRKTVPEFTTIDGIPYFRCGVGRDGYQLTYSYAKEKGGTVDFVREHFERNCRKVLRAVRADRKVIAGLTLRQRYERLREIGKAHKITDAKQLADMNKARQWTYFITLGNGSGDSISLFVDRSFGPKSARIELWGHGEAFSFATCTWNGLPRFSWEGLDQEFEKFEAAQASKKSEAA